MHLRLTPPIYPIKIRNGGGNPHTKWGRGGSAPSGKISGGGRYPLASPARVQMFSAIAIFFRRICEEIYLLVKGGNEYDIGNTRQRRAGCYNWQFMVFEKGCFTDFRESPCPFWGATIVHDIQVFLNGCLREKTFRDNVIHIT